ncbi:unnamed protein product [Gadus morhua 'NCC']
MDFLRTLVTFLSLGACVSSVSATNAIVEPVSKNYPCCESPEIMVDDHEDCEQTWESAEKKIIATYHPDQLAHPPECQAPCTSVSSVKISMDKCLNVQHNMICSRSDGTINEKNTNYIAITNNCPETPKPNARSAASSHNSYNGWVPGPLACVFTLICVVIPFYCARRNGGNHIQANQ